MKRFINTMRVLRGLNKGLLQTHLASLGRTAARGDGAARVQRFLDRLKFERWLGVEAQKLGLRLAATWIGLDALAELGRAEAATDLECARREFTPNHSHATSSCTKNREVIRRFGV